MYILEHKILYYFAVNIEPINHRNGRNAKFFFLMSSCQEGHSIKKTCYNLTNYCEI